jgi:nitric oxide reductase subunit C
MFDLDQVGEATLALPSHAKEEEKMNDPAFWRAGAISSTAVMALVLIFLTIDSLSAITTGGRNVPAYTVINQAIDYKFDTQRNASVPVIGGEQLLFGRKYSAEQAEALMDLGKLAIQSRACINCHTFFGNGAYYAPDLTKAWLDPVWQQMWMPMTQAATKEEAMVRFLMSPEKYPTWGRMMPNLKLTREESEAIVAYLKWMSAIDTNGFPSGFKTAETR